MHDMQTRKYLELNCAELSGVMGCRLVCILLIPHQIQARYVPYI